MFGYIFGFTAFAVVCSIIFELFNDYDRHLVRVAIWTGVVATIINWLIIYFGMPTFSHWLRGGWPLLFFLNLGIAAVVITISAYADNSWNNGGSAIWIIEIVLLVIYGLIVFFTKPAVCDTTATREKIGILNLQMTTSPYPETDLDHLIKVPQSVALARAGNMLSSGEYATLGNYLQPNRAYIQYIQDVPYYVIDLKVTHWIAFRQAGAVIPGYILVNAYDQDAKPEFRSGYNMEYAAAAQFGHDLDRVVYNNFMLGSKYFIQDLDGMEIDDNFEPYNVGTLIAYQGSQKITKPIGLYSFNPITGAGEQLSLEDKPEWLDRVWPLEWVKEYINLWGLYANHDACTLTQLGQQQQDWNSEVITPDGLIYQFTMTGMGNDPSLTQLITVNPRTGEGLIYPMNGKTIEGIQLLIETKSKNINPVGFKADACQVHYILGRTTAYCILVSSQTDSEGVATGDVSIGGYAFADIEKSINNDLKDIAVGATFDEAYIAYQQIVGETNTTMSLSNVADDVQITGTVQFNRLVGVGDSGNSYLISVVDSSGRTYWILASGTSLNAAAAVEGSTVTATCYQLPNQEYLTVRHIRVEGVPDLDK